MVWAGTVLMGSPAAAEEVACGMLLKKFSIVLVRGLSVN